MTQNMGIGRIGLGSTTHKRQFRWMVTISPFIGEAINMLPPKKGGRPDITFSEIKAEHLVESISYPGRPEWGTLDITVYDIGCKGNVIFNWLKRVYSPQDGIYRPSLNTLNGSSFKIPRVILNLFDGCGNIVEEWNYDNCWPLKIQWGELDMGSSEVVTVDLSLKYDRAYVPGINDSGPTSNSLIGFGLPPNIHIN